MDCDARAECDTGYPIIDSAAAFSCSSCADRASAAAARLLSLGHRRRCRVVAAVLFCVSNDAATTRGQSQPDRRGIRGQPPSAGAPFTSPSPSACSRFRVARWLRGALLDQPLHPPVAGPAAEWGRQRIRCSTSAEVAVPASDDVATMRGGGGQPPRQPCGANRRIHATSVEPARRWQQQRCGASRRIHATSVEPARRWQQQRWRPRPRQR